jgi:thioredoxin reductase (NADPH)
MSESNGDIRNVVIIGSGPAGLTAALYTSRAMLKPLVISGFIKGGQAGGQLMTTTEVENYPGYPQGVTGPDMMKEFREQAARFDTEFLDYADIEEVDLSERPFTLKAGKHTIRTKSLIVATGASANWLGCKGEDEFKNRGVTACATCDGALPIFRDKDLYVVGGGDTAVEEATFLTKYGRKVYMVHRRDQLRASKVMAQRAMDNPKIEILWNHELIEIRGDESVKEVVLKSTTDGATQEREAARRLHGDRPHAQHRRLQGPT